MLTDKHVAVLKAAVRFLEEEFCPHGADSVRHYLDNSDRELGITSGDIAEARQQIAATEIRYAVLDRFSKSLESASLASSHELVWHADRSIPVTVLISR